MYSTIGEYVYCVDWGTSSLRIRLVDGKSGDILNQINIGEGAYSVFDNWQKQFDFENTDSRIEFYLCYLKRYLDELKSLAEISSDKIPIIISGMASSSIGVIELPYAELPFAVNGESAVVRHFHKNPRFKYDVYILSGVKGNNEVMRGEETQLVGIASLVPIIRTLSESVIVLPGTHSKHIYVDNGFVKNIETYITGELFSILTKNGLIKDSVELFDKSDQEQFWRRAFKEGVEYSAETILLRGVFRIRVNQLLNKLNKQDNYNYLSGLLIGYELRELLKRNKQIVLCCEHNLYHRYKLALEHLGLKDRISFVNPDIVSTATAKGQMLITQKFLNKF